MNPRSKKYYESRKAQKGDKKGSATNAGYDEQNEKTVKAPKKNPATPKEEEQPKIKSEASQDDTGGGNDSGKRSDDN
jgi:sRNA-binding protein